MGEQNIEDNLSMVSIHSQTKLANQQVEIVKQNIANLDKQKQFLLDSSELHP